MKKFEVYESPEMEILELKNSDIVCESGKITGDGDGNGTIDVGDVWP